jgi:hypothetical protein
MAKNSNVRDEEERHRSEVGLPLSLQVGHREQTRTTDQVSEASKVAAVNLSERVEQLLEESAKCEIAHAQRPFAAERTIGRGDCETTGRARPRLGLGQAAPLLPDIVSPPVPRRALRPC